MDHGKIVEKGTHTELVNKQGAYYELWKGQNLNISEESSVIEWEEHAQ